jgi:hypothetical protein
MAKHPIEIVYKGVTYEKVLWNSYYGFNPENCMYESSDDKVHLIVVTKDAILEFGDYFKEDGFTVNWENFDKAFAELRKF